MHRVHITSIDARAERLDQPEVVDEYILRAERWGDGWLHLTDADHAYLNQLWREYRSSSGNSPLPTKGCKTCQGI